MNGIELNEGEHYAGLSRDPDTGQWRHLYARVKLLDAKTFHGHLSAAKDGGYEVAAIHELAIIRANCPEFQDLGGWVWSSTPYAGDERYAWVQYFLNGGQYSDPKDGASVAVAVRREPVQSFINSFIQEIDMTTTPETIPLPRMHSQYAGGEVMGVMAGEAGAPDYLLIHIGNSPKGMPFESALQWSRDQSGEEGPTPRELKMLDANRREGQFRNVGHWSRAPYAGDERYAWVQYFGNRLQLSTRKDGASVALAVRRVPFK